MLTKVDITNNRGMTLTLPFDDIGNGYAIEEITGLDPVKATISSSNYAQQDGAQYQSSRREARNLVFKIKLEPNVNTGSVRALRRALGTYFPYKTPVTFRFYDDEMDPVDIQGRVETRESPIFAEDPEANISVLCLEPDFYDPTPTIVSGSTVSDMTEFTIDYAGDVDTGVIFKMMVNRNLDEFAIYARKPDGSQINMNFAGTLVAGDVLTITTVAGNKGAILTRAGSDTSVLYWVDPKWFELAPGINFLRVYAGGAAVPFTIEYATKYEGL